MRPIRRHRSEGFSLVAVSLLLMVAAIILASVLPAGDADYNQQTIRNVNKLDRVEEAMRSYMVGHGHRPCPADGQYAMDSQYFGVAAANAGCQNGTPAAPLGPDATTATVVGGTIPTKSLGLPDDYAFDAWGRRFTYVVDTQATNIFTCYHKQVVSGTGNVRINDGTGTALDQTMYAYISHGPDGHGAFPAQGSSLANRINIGTTDADTLVNASVDNAFAASFSEVRVKKDRTSGFDDLTYYRNDLKNTCCIGALCTFGPGFRVDGEGANDASGYSVATGDINGDGITDLIIGARWADPGGAGDAGSVYVVFGTATGFPSPLPLSSLNGTNGFRVDGVAADDQSGISVATGDINDDGKTDLVIGAIGANPGGNISAGSIYVLFGGTGQKTAGNGWDASWSATFALSGLNGTNGFRVDGVAAGDYSGNSVATGDINGDGKTDLVIGAIGADPGGNSSAGSIYVLFGGIGQKNGANSWDASWSATFDLSGLTGTNGFRVDGVAAGDYSGNSVATGDINGDGNKDVITAAPFASPPSGGDAGSTYIFYGHSGAFTSPYDLSHLCTDPSC